MNLKLKLYHYWRSSSSWRVRYALALKKLEAEMIHIDILGGESESPEHLKRHPLGFVPVLIVATPAGEQKIVESVAMLEWLDENTEGFKLYPGDSFERAHLRALVELINADTQPVQNLTVMDRYSDDPEKRKAWNQYFIRRGLSAFEKICSPKSGKFSVGDQPTAADVLLIPQVYNAVRFEVDLSEFPIIEKIYGTAMQTPECLASHPDKFKP